MTAMFSGSTTLLLGGNCDLALDAAEMMIQAGLYPVLTYRSSKGLQDIQTRLSRYGGEYIACECDLNRRDTIHALFGRMGRDLDFLVDFSHGRLESFVASADTVTVDAYFMENVAARAEMIKIASRKMLERKKGRFVYISSTAAETPNPGQGFYAAAKLASEALYRNIDLELGNRGITSVILRPGYIDCGRGRQYLSAGRKTQKDKISRYGVLASRQVAEAVLYLLSDQAGAYNAGVFEMDGINGLRSRNGDVIEYKIRDCGNS